MLVIIHGWSDTSRSFGTLGRRLVDEGIVPSVTHVRLGDYISLDDNITFDDLTAALDKAWADEGLPARPRSVDVVVHSTGALVVRHWMTTKYRPTTNPVRRFLMLAPANFGSPLAHKGRSFIGRVVKGFKSDKPFQTGTHILNGLELASPFSWKLAMKDRFSSEWWYGPGRVLATVLVGSSGYTGISAAANEPGTDGTVRVATANLNPIRFTFDFTHKPLARGESPPPGKLSYQEPNGLTAFARIPEENHSTIAFKDGGPKNEATLPFIKRALQVTDSDFAAFMGELEAYSDLARSIDGDEKYQQGFQDTVVRLRDDFDQPIPDFFLELFAKDADERPDDRMTCMIQEEVLQTVHANDLDPSHRSLLLNETALRRIFVDGNRPLYISLTAMPNIHSTKSAGYSTVRYDDIGSIKIRPQMLGNFIRPDRTALVDIVISRRQEDRVFRFSPLRT